MKFDHIGIFVKDLESGRKYIKSLFPIASESSVIHEPLHKVSVQFFYDINNICYELIAPNGENNPVENSLSDNKNLLNHVAYKVEEFDKKVADFREKGCIPLGSPKPSIAFSGGRIMFFLSPIGIIVELIEEKNKP